ncbi:MAG: S8 family serine peptidase, partial [Bdellovibrionales bacterium]|nr:S8 family serine peptidase [Bdellovibrionales bacterium]
DIDIFQIRVLTEGQKTSNTERQRIAKNFMEHFEIWIENPTILHGLVDLFSPFLTSYDSTKPLEGSYSEVIHAEVKNLMQELFLNSADDGASNLIFMEQILKGIEVLGERKIKLTNVSLGMKFTAPSARPNKKDPEANLNELFKFVQFEMFKYLIADQIEKKAPGTLLVVAAGNDGGWIEGDSRTSLPAVIYSPYFADYESTYGKIPNNHTDNILVVGSLRPDGKNLSSFTNVVIRKGIPFVFSHGEAVVSGLNLIDQQGSKADYANQGNPEMKIVVPRGEEDFEGLVQAMGDQKLFENIEPSQLTRAKGNYLLGLSKAFLNVVSQIQESKTLDWCAHNTICVGPMSGTSVAAPHTTGQIAKMVVAKMKDKKIRDARQLYRRRSFAPRVLIHEFLADAEPLNPDLLLNVKKVTDVEPIRERPKAIDLTQPIKTCSDMILERKD